MLTINKFIYMLALIYTLALTVLSCTARELSDEDYNALLKNERIKRAEYEDMIGAINFCIKDRKHGQQPLVEDSITEGLLTDSSRVYCSDYTTTLEHPFVRYCRYFVYAQKNKSNVESCYCELIAKRKKIQDELKQQCEQLSKDDHSHSQAIVSHLGESFAEDCASLNDASSVESEYDCD